MAKKTPLYTISKEKYKAQFVDFGGWDMPVRYSSVVEEHLAVRNKAGIFDVSHMGNFILRGEDVYKAVNLLISNDLGKISPGQAIYTPLLYENGTFVDDIIVYYHNPNYFSIVVNAANIEKDYHWMVENIHKRGLSVAIEDLSSEKCLLAIQGKESAPLIAQLFPGHDQGKPFRFSMVEYEGEEVMVANTGYTGEPGVEVWCSNAVAPKLFEKTVSLGALPCGLGARDSLRLEKGYSLYGHEITDKTNALEAGLGWTVALSKEEFIGKASLEKIKAEGLQRKLIGIVMVERAIPRSGYPVYNAIEKGEQVGEITSGGYSPFLEKNIALSYVPRGFDSSQVYVDIRGRRCLGNTHKRVFC